MFELTFTYLHPEIGKQSTAVNRRINIEIIQWHRNLKSLLLAVSLIFLVFSLGASETAFIESFNPEGAVKDARKVSFRFSEPMVTVGSHADKEPFDVSCKMTGKGRWIDGTTWVYNFGANIPGGCSCEFA